MQNNTNQNLDDLDISQIEDLIKVYETKISEESSTEGEGDGEYEYETDNLQLENQGVDNNHELMNDI